MGYKLLELTLISAKDLESKKNLYVSAYLSGYPTAKKTISCNNHTLRFTFDEVKKVNANWYVVLKLKRRRSFLWGKLVGEVRVSLKDLDLTKTEAQTVTYKIRRPSSGEFHGELKFSYKAFDEVDAVTGLVIEKLLSNAVDEDDDYYDPRAGEYDC